MQLGLYFQNSILFAQDFYTQIATPAKIRSALLRGRLFKFGSGSAGLGDQILRVSLLFACLSAFGLFSTVARADTLDFSLPEWGRETELGLQDCKGEIVVLDFFAFWCDPCRESMPKIEQGIGEYYRTRGGNPQQIPVRLIAISEDCSNPSAVNQLIEQTGVKCVLADQDGVVFKKFGGQGIPFIAVVDMTGEEPRLVYVSEGFKGLEALRSAVDSVSNESNGKAVVFEATSSAVCSIDDPNCGSPLVKNPPIGIDSAEQYDSSVSGAFMGASDIQLLDLGFEYNLTCPKESLTLSAQYGHIGMDFDPLFSGGPFQIQEARLDEPLLSVQATGRFMIADQWRWTVGGGGYEGFSNYQSLWLDEYYRQLDAVTQAFWGELGIPRSANYQRPDPRGYHLSTDLRWEYLPTCGFVGGSLDYSQSTGLYSYEENPCHLLNELSVGNDTFHTVGAGLSFENILTRRIRSLQEVHIQRTTDRKLRTALKSSFNYALAESVVWRTELAFTHESPSFDGWSAGTTLEKDWNNRWFVSLAARYYEDTGEYLESTVANSTAPAVRAYQSVLGFRWQGRVNAVKVLAGHYSNAYLDSPSSPRFAPLYQDRDWIYTHISYTYQF